MSVTCSCESVPVDRPVPICRESLRLSVCNLYLLVCPSGQTCTSLSSVVTSVCLFVTCSCKSVPVDVVPTVLVTASFPVYTEVAVVHIFCIFCCSRDRGGRQREVGGGVWGVVVDWGG